MVPPFFFGGNNSNINNINAINNEFFLRGINCNINNMSNNFILNRNNMSGIQFQNFNNK